MIRLYQSLRRGCEPSRLYGPGAVLIARVWLHLGIALAMVAQPLHGLYDPCQ